MRAQTARWYSTCCRGRTHSSPLTPLPLCINDVGQLRIPSSTRLPSPESKIWRTTATHTKCGRAATKNVENHGIAMKWRIQRARSGFRSREQQPLRGACQKCNSSRASATPIRSKMAYELTGYDPAARTMPAEWGIATSISRVETVCPRSTRIWT